MKDMSVSKILIIRFSSFGDIVQCMSVLKPLKERFPNATIHWVTRSDFAQVLSMSSDVDRIYSFDKRDGLVGLIELKERLKKEKYDVIYDAHFNIRSRILCTFIAPIPFRFLSFIKPYFFRRSKDRLKRHLLFRWHKNFFPWPFKGMESFVRPLSSLGIELSDHYYIEGNFPTDVLSKVEKDLSHFIESSSGKLIALIPGAAWEMKRWPIEYWKQLVTLLPDYRFLVLGGPDDSFCQEIADASSGRCLNLAGRCSLLASCALLKKVDAFVSADTGLLHVGDILGVKGIALIGPTAFGFPSSKRIVVCESLLDCRPCTKDGRGKCIHAVYQYCLTAILPRKVADELQKVVQ